MAFPVLPPKYYLSHFFEFLDYLEENYLAVMEEPHIEFIKEFRALSEEAQCVYVRMVNRKGAIFEQEVFKKYSEIEAPLPALEELKTRGFISALQTQDKVELLNHLTKPKLLHWLKQHDLNPRPSLSKNDLIELSLTYLENLDVEKLEERTDLVVQRRAEEMQYLLFLYFGRIQKSLNLYTLRDLGIRQSGTIKTDKFKPRFTELEHAKAEYFFARELEIFYTSDLQDFSTLVDLATNFNELRSTTQLLKDELLFRIGEYVLETDPDLALKALSVSLHPEARVKLIRHLYKCDQKDLCRELLEKALEEPRDDVELLFAEDFLARKFEKKRQGYLSETIKNSPEIELSDFYLKRPEDGVCHFYREQGFSAEFTENYLWVSLFGCFFWKELFENEDVAIHSPFERSPSDLVGRDFYIKNEKGIEEKLRILKDPDTLEKLILKTITENYGRLNDIFQWHPNMAPQLIEFLKHATQYDLAHILKTMSQNFESYHSGYPDLKLEKDGHIKFIEVKAEGDSLRASQLAKMRLLREAGFEVEILRVRWKADPNQSYVVVDVETTGGSQSFHRVTEIGAVKVQNGKIIDEFQTLINPGRSIPAFITQITGISNEMVKDAPPFSAIADSFLEFLEGSIFVAHNVKFDYGFIQREFARCEIDFVRPCICTCSGMRKAYPGISSYGLKSLTEHFEIPLESHHRAMCDARAAAELLLLMKSKQIDSARS